MPANLLPRVSDRVFALAAALIVKKELLFFNNVDFYLVCQVCSVGFWQQDPYLRYLYLRYLYLTYSYLRYLGLRYLYLYI